MFRYSIGSPRRHLVVWVALLCGLLLTAVGVLQGAEPFIRVTPDSVQYGGVARLCWNSGLAQFVYIPGFGLVEPVACKDITPRSAGKYVLIASPRDGSPIALETTVQVSGSRGLEPCAMEPELYNPVVSSHFRSPGFPAYAKRLEAIRLLLQDSLGFSVFPALLPSNRVAFVTSCSQRAELVASEEPRIGARRISFLVEISVPENFPSIVTYTVRALIQYRRRAESTWRREDAETLYRKAAAVVRNGIDALPGSASR